MRTPKKRLLRQKIRKWVPDRPGTPGYRFNFIMNELEARWPDPDPYSARAGERRILQMMDKERLNMKAALKSSITALKEVQTRLQEDGMIANIADVVTQCRKALKENIEEDFKVSDRVRIVKSTDPDLEGQVGTIMGFYSWIPIVVFDVPPPNCNPAIVMTPHCLERIE